VALGSSSVDVPSANRMHVVVNLSTADLNRIKADTLLGVQASNTFFVGDAGFVQDTSGNAVAAFTGLAVPSVVPDTTAPVILGVALDVNASLLRVTFDEPASVAVLASLALKRVSGADADKVPLASADITYGPLSTVVDVELTAEVVHSVQADTGLCTTGANCFLEVGAGSVVDYAAVPIASTAVAVSPLVADDHLPALVNFTFSLDGGGTLVFVFSEPVVEGSFDLTQVTLRSNATATSVAHTLTAVASAVTSSTSTVLTVIVGQSDSNSIKSLDLCTSAADCFVQLGAAVVTDFEGDAFAAVAVENSTVAASYGADTSPVELVDIHVLDLNDGTINMTFSEPVNLASIDYTKAVLRNTIFEGAGLVSLALSGGSVVSANQLTLTITLSTTDLNAIKLQGGLCTSSVNCFVLFKLGFISDQANNSMTATTGDVNQRFDIYDSLQADVVEDTTAPAVTSFGLDMEAGVLTLTFDEPVNSETVSVAATTTLSGAASASVTVALTSPVEATSFGTQSTSVNITLNADNLLTIKATNNTALSLGTTFLSLGAGFIKDIARVPNAPTTDTAATFYLADGTAPALASFVSADFNDGFLELSFNELVTLASLDLTKVTLFGGASGTDASFQLTGGAKAYKVNTRWMVV
jgi:hypothetical protein